MGRRVALRFGAAVGEPMTRIMPIRPEQVSGARAVMDTVFRELWDITYDELAARYDPLLDMADPVAYYVEHGGLFLVVEDGAQVVGTGGILGLGEADAELKRLWLLPGYRGLGLGWQLTEALLHHAAKAGYRRVLLEVATPEKQKAAVALYSRLGFRPIPAYREGPCALAMEKRLRSAG